MSKRMIEHLFAEGALKRDIRTDTLSPWSIEELQNPLTGRSFFREAEVLCIDNVTKFLYEVSDQDTWHVSDFPNCAPPFPVFWMETRAPAYIRVGATIQREQQPHAWGSLFIAQRLDQVIDGMGQKTLHDHLGKMAQTTWEQVVRVFALQHVAIPREAPSDKDGWFAGLPEECRAVLRQYQMAKVAQEQVFPGFLSETLGTKVQWHYLVVPFLQLTAYGQVHGPLMYGNYAVQPDGTLLEFPNLLDTEGSHQGSWAVEHGEYLAREEQEQFATYGQVSHYPMWLALSFLHCKNVTLTTEDPCHQRKPPKSGEHCRRLHYKVLDIKPMQEVLRREGNAQAHGLKHSLHICRGHFKDYREHGLFGKYHGLFWWESHLRGSSDRGITIKDYAIHKPPVSIGGGIP